MSNEKVPMDRPLSEDAAAAGFDNLAMSYVKLLAEFRLLKERVASLERNCQGAINLTQERVAVLEADLERQKDLVTTTIELLTALEERVDALEQNYADLEARWQVQEERVARLEDLVQETEPAYPLEPED